MDNDNKIINVQLYPSYKRIVPNFKLAKVTANQSHENYGKLLEGTTRGVVEKRKTKKRDNVITTYTLTNADGYDNTEPIDETDRAVLSVCCSAYEAGLRYMTLGMIIRGLTGKTRENHNGTVNPDQRDTIIHSLQKLMSTIITIDLTDTNKKLHYKGEKKITSTLLPAKYITTIINGQPIEDVIYFLDESPYLTIAKSRKQLLTYDANLLDVPNQKNTPLVITLKNYAMNRIQEIKLHHMTPTLTLDDIFKKCRIENSSRDTKMNARNSIEKFFAHLQDKGEIKSFEWTKKGNKFYSLKFKF